MMPTLNFLRVIGATALSSVLEKWHLLCRSMSKQKLGEPRASLAIERGERDRLPAHIPATASPGTPEPGATLQFEFSNFQFSIPLVLVDPARLVKTGTSPCRAHDRCHFD